MNLSRYLFLIVFVRRCWLALLVCWCVVVVGGFGVCSALAVEEDPPWPKGMVEHPLPSQHPPQSVKLMPNGEFFTMTRHNTGEVTRTPVKGRSRAGQLYWNGDYYGFPRYGEDGMMWLWMRDDKREDFLVRYDPWTGKERLVYRKEIGTVGRWSPLIDGLGWAKDGLWLLCGGCVAEDGIDGLTRIQVRNDRLSSKTFGISRLYSSRTDKYGETDRLFDFGVMFRGGDGRVWAPSQAGHWRVRSDGVLDSIPGSFGLQDLLDTPYKTQEYRVVGSDGWLWSSSDGDWSEDVPAEIQRFDVRTNTLQRFRIPDRRLNRYHRSEVPYSVWGLQPGPDGNIWFIRQRLNYDLTGYPLNPPDLSAAAMLGRITPGGQVRFWKIEEPNYGPSIDHVQDFVVGPDGQLWVLFAGSQTLVSVPVPGGVRGVVRPRLGGVLLLGKRGVLSGVGCVGLVGRYCFGSVQLLDRGGRVLSVRRSVAVPAGPVSMGYKTVVPLPLNGLGKRLFEGKKRLKATLVYVPKIGGKVHRKQVAIRRGAS